MPIFSTKRAACTRVGYARNFAAFQQWCADHDESPLPASREAILGYVRGLRRSLSRASIHVRLAAINAAHYDQKKTAPIDMRLWGDIARALKSQRGGERKKFSLVDGDLSRLLATCKGETPKDLRVRAIILCSRHGALTISEVSALSLADLHWTDRGCVLRIDPARELVRIDRSSLCPVRALERWLAVDGHATGRVFHSVGANGVYR